MVSPVEQARALGYTDKEIADYYASTNPKVNEARGHGYSDNEIADHFSASPQMHGVLRGPALAAYNTQIGLTNTANLPSKIGDLINQNIAAPVAKKIAPYVGIDPDLVSPYDSGLSKEIPLPNRPDLQPQNASERLLAATFQGAGGALPIAATGGLGAIPMGVASGAGTGLAVQGLHEAGINDPYVDFAAGVAGGAVGSNAMGGIQRGINAMRGEINPIAQIYKTAGITPKISVNTNPDSTVLSGARALAQGGKAYKNAATDTVGQFNNSVEDLASNYGKSTSAQEAGTALQDSGSEWLKQFKKESGNRWQQLNQTIGSDTPVSMPNTESYLNNIKLLGGNNQAAQQFLGSKLSKDFDNILNESKGNYQPANINPNTLVFNPATGQQAAPLTWQTVQKLRSRVGEYLENPSLVEDAGGAQAKQLYANLSKDMQNTAAMHSTQAQQLFNDANAFTSNGHDFIDNTLNKIMNTSPEKAASQTLATARLGGSTLQSVRDNLPDAADELAAYSIRKMNPGADVQPSDWVKGMAQRQMSPEASNALFANPKNIDKLNALDKVSTDIIPLQKAMNSDLTHTPAYAPFITGEGAGTLAHFNGLSDINSGAVAIAAMALPSVAKGVSNQLTTNPLITKWAQGLSGGGYTAPTLSTMGELPWWLQNQAAFGALGTTKQTGLQPPQE